MTEDPRVSREVSWMINIPVKAVLWASSLSLMLWQVAPAGSTVPGIDALGRLSLDGCLITAVVALWRALSRKDEQVVEMAKKITETMVLVTTAIGELRETVKELKEGVRPSIRDERERTRSIG